MSQTRKTLCFNCFHFGPGQGVRLCPLHAAAPELVAALEQIGYGVLGRADMSWRDAANEMERIARAVLAKVKGG